MKANNLTEASTEKEVKFPAKAENISIAEKLIDDITAEKKLSSEIYGNILVAVVEAVNNAILHGNKANPQKHVTVRFNMANRELYFKVIDEGEGFDYDSIPDPTLPENLEKPFGRGIFLIKHLADEVQFNEEGNEIEIKFKV